MKLKTLPLFILALAAVVSVVSAQQNPAKVASKPVAGSHTIPKKTLPFGPGEESRFAIKFGPIRAGTASLSVPRVENMNGETVFLLESRAQSSRFFSTFFKVDDKIQSWWSPVRRIPLKFEKNLHEGKYKANESVVFHHEQGKAVYSDGEHSEILADTQDILSAFFSVRAADLHNGEVIINNHADKKNYALKVRVIDRERVKVPAGEYNCIVVEPLLKTAGLFKQEGRLTIWLTDDARKMPVIMKSEVAVGAIVAELESYRAPRNIAARW